MNKLTDDGLALIKHFEGLRLEAYECSAGVWTIGYGTTYTALGKVRQGQKITESEAERMLLSDARMFGRRVSDLVTVPLTDAQYSALVAFTYNVGPSALAESTLLRKLNRLDYSGAADEFLRWDKADGKVLAGLTRRRKAERIMFLGRDWTVHAEP